MQIVITIAPNLQFHRNASLHISTCIKKSDMDRLKKSAFCQYLDSQITTARMQYGNDCDKRCLKCIEIHSRTFYVNSSNNTTNVSQDQTSINTYNKPERFTA